MVSLELGLYNDIAILQIFGVRMYVENFTLLHENYASFSTKPRRNITWSGIIYIYIHTYIYIAWMDGWI